MKRVAIFNPYWETYGGGEKYTATAALAFSKKGYQVQILWHDPDLLSKLTDRFGFAIPSATIDIPGYQAVSAGIYSRYQYLKTMDAVFWLSDGSLPLLFSKNNLLHFQVPFTHCRENLINFKLKKLLFHQVICNSKFTQSVINQTFGFTSRVVYPPATLMPQVTKTEMILSVGRFDNLLQHKHQDVLIDAFRQGKFAPWRLVLAGGVQHGSQDISQLKNQASGLPIEFVVNPSFTKLQSLYAKAGLYWHAAGYGVNAVVEPEKVEHFGITTVEAMSAGAIPLVYGAGGQLEIIQNDYNGYTWQTLEELIAKTHSLIQSKTKFEQLKKAAVATSQLFSPEKFIDEFSQYIR